jgi:hypothetical protein
MKSKRKLYWYNRQSADNDLDPVESEGKDCKGLIFARIRKYSGELDPTTGFHVHTATGAAGSFLEDPTCWSTLEEAQARARELYLESLPKKKFEWANLVGIVALLCVLCWSTYRQFMITTLQGNWNKPCAAACVEAGFDTGFVNLPLNFLRKPVALGCTA